MKFLFIDFTLPFLLRDSEYPVGGWAVELKCWLQGLNACGHKAGVLTWKGAAVYAPRTKFCELLDTYDPKRGIKILKYFYSYVPSMVKAARAYRPDVIIQACAGVNTGIMAYIAKRLDVPFIYRVVGDTDTDQRLSRVVPQRYARMSYAYGLRSATAILCQNQYQLDHLRLQNLNATLAIVHNPFAIDVMAQPLTAPQARDYIAWLAVFRDGKNLPLLVRLAKALPTIRFRVGGMPEGNPSKSLREAIAALEVLPNVEMVGYVKRTEVWRFLSNARALLSTSDSEGFSNTILESLSVGTPLVLRRQVDPDLIISKNELGFTAADEQELVRKLEAVWDIEPARFAEMSDRCITYVKERHDPVAKVQEMIAIIDPILAQWRANRALSC